MQKTYCYYCDTGREPRGNIDGAEYCDRCHHVSVVTESIYNGTPHSINIVSGAEYNPEIRKFTGGEVVATIPSDGALNAQIDSAESGTIYNIPVYAKQITGCDPLPGNYHIYIVSALYASAYKTANPNDNRIYTVADPVMTDDGKTFRGCRGIQAFSI
ncbi:MAG: hypothetical protein FWH48_10495 [Oscillospiraceae bacterium]|nr:hypothetical protein [Oscillospiraceae bacterium]